MSLLKTALSGFNPVNRAALTVAEGLLPDGKSGASSQAHTSDAGGSSPGPSALLMIGILAASGGLILGVTALAGAIGVIATAGIGLGVAATAAVGVATVIEINKRNNDPENILRKKIDKLDSLLENAPQSEFLLEKRLGLVADMTALTGSFNKSSPRQQDVSASMAPAMAANNRANPESPSTLG